jgi:hypothetical protein
MKDTIMPIVLWGLWTLVLLGSVVFAVIRYRSSRRAREQDEIARAIWPERRQK